MSTINRAGRADGTTNDSVTDRPISTGGVKAVGVSAVNTPGIDDGWDSASSTSWATELAEPNEEARRHAWQDHDDHLERRDVHRELAREEADVGAEGPEERASLSAEELTGEVAAVNLPMQEAQNKLGLRSLRQADTALQHSLRASQSNAASGAADRVASTTGNAQTSTDEQSHQR